MKSQKSRPFLVLPLKKGDEIAKSKKHVERAYRISMMETRNFLPCCGGTPISPSIEDGIQETKGK